MAKDTIPDLGYVITRGRAHFSRYACALIFYRHDREGKPYIYHVETFAGHDGRTVRRQAGERARNVIRRKAPMGLRSTYIPHNYAKPADMYVPK